MMRKSSGKGDRNMDERGKALQLGTHVSSFVLIPYSMKWSLEMGNS